MSGLLAEGAPLYGLFAAVAVATPLFAGIAAHRIPQGVIAALGAYLAAVRVPEGTYGQKARTYAIIVPEIGIGEFVGGLLDGHRWTAVLLISALAAFGAFFPRLGQTLALATLFATIRPPTQNVLHGALLSVAGALVMVVLVLLPWPGRRIRPLTDALSEAVERVAGALDAVTGPAADWERRRRAASDAIGRARTTYGVYNTSSEDDRPSRLIRTVVKILHEVVALRTLIDAEAARPLHRDLATETSAAVAVSAARLRQVSQAVIRPTLATPAPPGPDPGEDGERVPIQGALHRLEERTNQVRREAFEGTEDMVAAALAAQVWRSVDRLDSTIEAADRIVAAGITLRLALVPRLPEPPSPLSWWRRLVRALRVRPPSLRYGVRAGLTMLVAMVVWAEAHLPHGHWLPLAALMCLRGTYGETVSRVSQRIGGTAIGAVAAALLLVLSPGHYTLAAIIFVFAVFGFAVIPVSYLWWVILCTPLVMMLIDFAVPVPWDTAAIRIGLTIAGSMLALLAARLLWPAAPTDQLPAVVATMLDRHAEVIRAVANADDAQGALSPWLRPAQDAARRLSTETDRMAHDPAPDSRLIGRLREAITSAHRIRDEAITVAGMVRAESAAIGPVSAILERLADHLAEAADIVRAGDGAGSLPTLDLDDLLKDLDGQLALLVKRRRAEVVEGGTDLSDTTPLRRDLLSVAAVRHAVRSLRDDTQTLAAHALHS
jgi:uncharacterized membrane protein YccC